MIIYIRHAEKLYKNNYSPSKFLQHDPGLSEKGKNDLKKFLEHFEKIFNCKNIKIISSPYLRCRETSEIIKKELNIQNNIQYDILIREFLGFQKNKQWKDKYADVTNETKVILHDKCGIESLNTLKKRVKKFHNIYKNKEDIYIVVTHGIVLDYINKNARKKKFNIDYIIYT